nr:LysR family transcriptional regulator [Pseudovibrio denitrificans]
MALVDWEMLPYFLAVARAGSLRAGADLLNANHVTVDRSIKSLEASYGVQLFTRTSRGFEVTDAGEELLPVAEEIEKLITTARHRVEGLDKTEAGTIRFSLPPVLAHDVIAPIIAKFSSTYPEINVELRLTDTQESISRSETDISLRVAYEIDEDTIARKLYPMAIGTFASKEYLKANMPDAGTGGSGLNWIGWTGPGSSPVGKPISLPLCLAPSLLWRRSHAAQHGPPRLWHVKHAGLFCQCVSRARASAGNRASTCLLPMDFAAF